MINWIKIQLKRFWKWLLALLVGGTVITQVVGFPPIQTPEEAVISKVQKLQEIAIKSGKYKQFKNINEIDSTLKKGGIVKVFVQEYVSPQGPGYQIILTREIPITGSISVSYFETKSIGYGPEGNDISRTWNWK